MKKTLMYLLHVLVIPGMLLAQVPVLHSLLSDANIIEREGRPWIAPDYNTQGQALGLDDKTFEARGLISKARDFWLKVYTEYESQQGIIHDSENLSVIYEVVNFANINADDRLSDSEKKKARESLVEDTKKRIFDGLQRVSLISDEDSLSDYEKKLQQLWSQNGDKEALKGAADPSRIRLQIGQKDRIKEAIFLSGRYLPMMEEIFRREGLPLQLTRLVFVESSFNIAARSKVGASGLWQIMPSAARGRLRINRTVDLRNHPREATELAAKMLKYNFQLLGSWPLAITGYNHGPHGVKRLVEKYQTTKIEELIETREAGRFGFASRNFFASFLAALHVEGHANQYFPNIKRAPDLKAVPLRLAKPIFFSDLIKLFDGDRAMAELYNPHLQARVYANQLKIDNSAELVIPEHLRPDQGELEAQLRETVRGASREQRSRRRRQVSSEGNPNYEIKATKYRVKKGDTLFRISRTYKVSVDKLLKHNNLPGPGHLKAGMVLKIP